MSVTVGLLNLLLGCAYTTYGILTLIDMRRGWATMGFSHFGAAWVAMAFTCGPHHIEHGLHNLFVGRSGGPLDVFAVVIGLPVGLTWLFLRIEAFVGGRGDRTIHGTPDWVVLAPFIGAAYVAVLLAGIYSLDYRSLSARATPNLMLLVIYCAIGYFLLRTQLSRNKDSGEWSVSGLSLAAVFPTCGLMHTVFVAYATSGRYGYDIHGYVIDWLAVPAGLYFLWVVRGLYHGALRDWNRQSRQLHPLAGAIS